MAKRRLPTPEQLRQLLNYDPETGNLTWRERPLSMFKAPTRARQSRACKMWNGNFAGKPAGATDGNGYLQIKLFDRSTPAHRIAWAITYGEWPEIIDHINGDPSDNRIANLRSGSREMNQRNQRRHKSNTSGRTGVSWNAKRRLWTAQIKMNDISFNLGAFDKFEDAVAERERVERKFGFTGRQ